MTGFHPLQYELPHPQEELLLDSAILALEDGTVFEGRSFGAPAERSGEVSLGVESAAAVVECQFCRAYVGHSGEVEKRDITATVIPASQMLPANPSSPSPRPTPAD